MKDKQSSQERDTLLLEGKHLEREYLESAEKPSRIYNDRNTTNKFKKLKWIRKFELTGICENNSFILISCQKFVHLFF